MARLDGKVIAETLAAYAEGQSYADKERLKSLKSLSTRDSLRIFLSLWKAWLATNPSPEDIESLDRLKIAHLVQRRASF